MRDVSFEEVRNELNLAWRKDRALHLILILLDSKSPDEGRDQSAECLEGLVCDDAVYRFIEYRFFVAPLPGTADVEGALAIARRLQRGKIRDLLTEIQDHQEAIRLCRRAWEVLSVDLFGSAAKKEEFAFRAVEAGVFRRLASMQPVELSAARDIQVAGFPRSRHIITQWIRETKASGTLLKRSSAVPHFSASKAEEINPRRAISFQSHFYTAC